MYARKIKFKIQRWNYIVQRDKYSFSSSCHDYSIGQCSIGALRAWNQNSLGGLVEKYLSKSPWSLGHPSERFLGRSDISWSSCSMLRFYSSEGDGRSASEDTTDNARNSDAHARLGEQDQLEWLRNEKLARESKESSPFLTRRERFRNEFLRRVVPWEKITVSWDTFPYYLRKHTKDLLVECTASHMRNKKLATDYGGLLNSSRGRILLQSIPGTELYRDRVVRALARDLQVPLLVLDSSVLGNQAISRGILFKWSTSGESRSSTASSNSKTTAEHSDKARRPLKKGDPVKYIGQPIVIAHQCDYLSCNDFLHVDNQRTISKGQRGEVYEVKGDQVAVILDSGKATKEGERDEKSAEPAAQPSLCWLHVKDIKHDLDCYVAMEVLFEVLESQQPVIVYFPDSSLWLSRAVSKSNRKEFVRKLQEMFDRLSGPVVLICGQNKVAAKEKDKFPLPLRRLTEGLKATNQSGNVEIFKLFTNVVSLSPPKEEDLLRIFIKQIEEDRRIVLSRRNLYEMHKVLEMHGLSCMDLLHVNTDGLILTKQSQCMVWVLLWTLLRV
ncbi:hypothetical protein ACJIZ3_009933 [Penstemon smallii]|uniref:Uncharacterized protein n=1 Tax=Penstemon smallii TaxID=265156 RepID=A0ABD3TEH0_9LAMI